MRIRALQPELLDDIFDFTDAIDTAEGNSGGWLVFVLHDLCAASSAQGAPSSAVSDRARSSDVLDWIDTQNGRDGEISGRGARPTGRQNTANRSRLTAPADRATVDGSNVSLTATAGDDVSVDHVDFLVNGNVVGTDSSSPYAYNWDSSASAGRTVSITAKAYDRATSSGDLRGGQRHRQIDQRRRRRRRPTSRSASTTGC